MNDILRIFLIIACMLLSFRLGMEYAARKAFNAVMEGIQEAMREFHAAIARSGAPTPNETINDIRTD